MVHKSLLVYVLLAILVLDVSIVTAMKTSNKHKSMVTKAAKESESEAAPVPVKAEEETHVTKKSDAATVTASATAAKPSSTENKDNDAVIPDEETAIGLLETDPIEKDEEAIVTDETALMGTTPGFLITRFREVFVQLLRMFGLRTASSKRKHRQMDIIDAHEYAEENVIEPSNYKEQIRTTVGAVLGRPDCIKRAACRAGRYLRDVKGKDIIIVILEKVTPSKWLETVQVVKDSAIHNDECNYKCLED